MTAGEIAADPGRWLEERRKGITATDAAVILTGGYANQSPFKLWHQKAGNLPPDEDSDFLRHCRYQEAECAELWEERAGAGSLDDGGLWRDGWRMATPDRLVFAHDREDEPAPLTGVLECKSVGSWDGWGHGLGKPCTPDCPAPLLTEMRSSPPELRGYCLMSRQVPGYVRVQALWQADVLGVPVGHVGALHRLTGEFRWYTLDAWNGMEQDDAFAVCRQFHQSVKLGQAPPVDGAEATTAALKALHHPADPPRTAFLDRALVNVWEEQREQAKRYEALAKLTQNKVRLVMGDAKYARYIDEEGQEWQVATRIVSKVAGHERDEIEYERIACDD